VAEKIARHAMTNALRMVLCVAAVFAISGARADPTPLRVGNASVQAFPFIPYDIGVAKGFFAKYGVATEKIDFSGSAKLHQGMIADAVDIGLGAGTDLQFVAKGAPELGVAEMAGLPYFLGVM
jgi:ABC-type nitrate/sulfonate/bicarbonate transport system substrate-binding protein